MELQSHTVKGVNKTARYGWVTKDEPGELKLIHKDLLHIHPAYQRDVSLAKIASITATFSWLSFGVLVVAERDGKFWLIDGQHRGLAAKRRSDIEMLPCIVFKTVDVKDEARGFLDLNTHRKPVSAVDKQRAKVAAGDEIALFVAAQCRALGLEIKTRVNGPGQLKCVALCTSRAAEDKEAFVLVLTLAAELCAKDNLPVSERMLEGLWMLNVRCPGGLQDPRLLKRLRDKGAQALLLAANRASAAYANGGARIWALGMLSELNRGLQRKFVMAGEED